MRLLFLWSWSAYTVGADNYQSNMMIEDQDGKLLIDCWSDIRHPLHELWYSYLDIKDIYISHLHLDHVWWLEFLWFSSKFDPRATKPKLYLHESLVEPLWENILSGCMKTLQWEEARLETFFNIEWISNNWSFQWHWIDFKLVQTIHVIHGFSIVPSYWLYFIINWVKVFITTDTQFTPNQLMPIYNEADVIFHDCEISTHKSYVHAHYDDLKTLPDNIKHKIWLYHYQPKQLPDAQADWFRWFVKKWQIFDFEKVETLGNIYFSAK